MQRRRDKAASQRPATSQALKALPKPSALLTKIGPKHQKSTIVGCRTCPNQHIWLFPGAFRFCFRFPSSSFLIWRQVTDHIWSMALVFHDHQQRQSLFPTALVFACTNDGIQTSVPRLKGASSSRTTYVAICRVAGYTFINVDSCFWARERQRQTDRDKQRQIQKTNDREVET